MKMSECVDEQHPPTYEQIQRIAEVIKKKTIRRPTIAVICGSGLGGLADMIEKPDIIPYVDIPDFPISTVTGHIGQLVFGDIEGHDVVLMQGRCHLYEGYPAWKLAIPIRTLYILGVKVVIVTNAAGGINPSFSVGDIMIIKDHISFAIFSGNNPLIGFNDDRFGPRFPAMSDAYDKSLRSLAFTVGTELSMDYLHQGVYSMNTGPMYETVAECRLLKLLGSDAAGMSTVPEVIAARHCGMRVLGMSLITNMVVLDYNSTETTNHEEVLETGKKRSKDLIKFVKVLISRI